MNISEFKNGDIITRTQESVDGSQIQHDVALRKAMHFIYESQSDESIKLDLK